MPIVTTRKQRHNKRKETTKKPTRQSRRLVGRWTATSRVPRCEVANMNTRKTKGGSLTNFFTKYGNCDIAYENVHNKTIKELEILADGEHQPLLKNSAVLCGSVLSYEEENNKKYLCIKRINDGRHRTGNSWITKRSYFLPNIHRKLIKKKDDKVRVIVGLGIQASKNTNDQITDFEKEFESTFKKAKDDSLAIITNMMGTQNVSYTFNGYSCNAVQNSANASELQKKEPHVLFTVDVRRSKTRDTKQNTEQGFKIEDIIKKIRSAIDVSVFAFNSAEFTIETRIKIIYSILFLKEYAYQIISTLLIFFELHELIKDTENVREDVHRLILEFYFGRLSAQATDEMLHIQEVCANKVLFHKKVDGITKPQKKTTAELITNLNDLKNKMVQIQLQGNEKINMFDEMFSKMRTIVLKHNLNIISAQKTTVSGLVQAKKAVLQDIKKQQGGVLSQIKDDEFSYYTYCMYMLKTFDICKEIIGTRDITAEEWGNPHELLQQIIQSIKKVNIVDTDVKDHEIYEIERFEKMKARSLKHSINDIVHICKDRRKYTDYIRQKLSLYQNVCFRKVSEELLRRYYNQQQVLNEKHRTIRDKEKDIGHKNEKFATFKDALTTRGSLGNTDPALKTDDR